MASSLVEYIDGITDNIIAIALVIGGIVLVSEGRADDGWKMITLSAGYVFGKSLPVGNK